KEGERPLVDGPHWTGPADRLEVIERRGEFGPRLRPATGQVLGLEQFAEAFPGHAGRLLILPVVQFVLQVNAGLLGLLLIGRAAALALAPARVRVDPLENQGRAVLEALHPDRDAFVWHPHHSYNATVTSWNGRRGSWQHTSPAVYAFSGMVIKMPE